MMNHGHVDLVRPAGKILGALSVVHDGTYVIAGPPRSGRTRVAIEVAAQAARAGRTSTYVAVHPAARSAAHRAASHGRASSRTRSSSLYITVPGDPLILRRADKERSVLVIDDAHWSSVPDDVRASLLVKVTHPTSFTASEALRWHLPGAQVPRRTRIEVNLPGPLLHDSHLLDALRYAGLTGAVPEPVEPCVEPSPPVEAGPVQSLASAQSGAVRSRTIVLDVQPASGRTGTDAELLDIISDALSRADVFDSGEPPVLVTADPDAEALYAHERPPRGNPLSVTQTLGQTRPDTVVAATNTLLAEPRALAVATTRHRRSVVIVALSHTRHPLLDRLRQQGRTRPLIR